MRTILMLFVAMCLIDVSMAQAKKVKSVDGSFGGEFLYQEICKDNLEQTGCKNHLVPGLTLSGGLNFENSGIYLIGNYGYLYHRDRGIEPHSGRSLGQRKTVFRQGYGAFGGKWLLDDDHDYALGIHAGFGGYTMRSGGHENNYYERTGNSPAVGIKFDIHHLYLIFNVIFARSTDKDDPPVLSSGFGIRFYTRDPKTK